jgi:hypothetical protein
MIDMKDDFLTSQFDSSILGQQLIQWSTLTDSPAIHHLWMENPRLLSFLWFSTLQEMLFIVHCWIKAQRIHSDQGFFSATDAVRGSQRLLIVDTFPSHIPGQTTTLLDGFTRYDLHFATRWYDVAYSPHDLTWRSQPPQDQFVHVPHVVTPKVAADKRDPGIKKEREQESKKRPKLESVQAIKAAADFNCGAHLFMPIIPLPKDQPAITTILSCLTKGTCFLKMPDSHGTFENICFHSSFPPPHNCCITSMPPTTRLHINPSADPWKSQPKAFWQPVVEFLKQDDVASHFKPSSTLIALTPSTSWS